MKALPVGLSTLKMILDNDMVYVDKTQIIRPLVIGVVLEVGRTMGKGQFV